MVQPVMAILQAAKAAAMHMVPCDITQPLPSIAPFLVAQNLLSK